MAAEDGIDLKKYQKVRFLGRGTFGEVYLHTLLPAFKDDNLPPALAVKKITEDLKNIAQDKVDGRGTDESTLLDPEKHRKQVEEMQKELKGLIRAQHANVVAVYWISSEVRNAHMKLAMEFCNCDLKKLLGHDKWKAAEWDQVRLISLQLVQGVAYLHEQGILHRDIKSANTLLKFEGELDDKFPSMQGVVAKISDFGFSSILEERSRSSMTACGSPAYMSPEMKKARYEETEDNSKTFKSPQPFKTDVYSTGVMLYELRYLTRKMERDGDGEIIKVPNSDSDVSSELFRDLYNKMLRIDIGSRIDMQTVLAHNFFA